eukprot:295670-Prymnesium_polylepis.1
MFYNCVPRRNAMKGAGEEYGKLLGVVQAYAIDNAGVAMSCKKQGEGSPDLHSLKEHSTADVIRAVYGRRASSQTRAPRRPLVRLVCSLAVLLSDGG